MDDLTVICPLSVAKGLDTFDSVTANVLKAKGHAILVGLFAL